MTRTLAIGSGQVDPNDPIYLGNPLGISAYADRQTDAANTYLLRLGDATAGLAPPTITPEFPVGGSAPALSIPAPPTMGAIVWTSPTAPDTFTGSVSIDDLLPEPFDDDPPALVIGSAPAAFTEAAPDAPGVNLVYEEPTLDLTLPAPPSLLTISVTPFSGLNMPTLTADEPVLSLVEPSIREYTPGAAYTSALLTTLKTKLQDWIENGGSGIDPAVENALWDRGREREARAAREAILKLEQMEALGYALPPGNYMDQRLKIITESEANDRGLSREVMIKAAELEQENLKVSLQAAQNLEGTLINYSNQVEERLFNATRYATEAGVSIYNAKVQAFGALVDVYRSKIQAYEAQIRAETAKVDAYRAQMEAERAKADVNQALVTQYKTQADVALSAIEIYRARIAGIQAKADIEKTKVEIFGEQVRAYGAKVNAYTAGVEGFRASLEAETSKQRAYQSQVDAYTARVGAAAKVADVRIAELKAQLDARGIEWDGYRAAIQGESARVQAIAQGNTSLAESYRAEISGVSAYNEVLTKQWQATLDQNQRTAEIAVSAAKANAELYVTTRSLALDAAKVGAQVSSQLGAAALNAINWSTSLSTSNSWANSTSFSNSISDAFSESVSTSYNYNYSV